MDTGLKRFSGSAAKEDLPNPYQASDVKRADRGIARRRGGYPIHFCQRPFFPHAPPSLRLRAL